jgi:hypothetical protein
MGGSEAVTVEIDCVRSAARWAENLETKSLQASLAKTDHGTLQLVAPPGPLSPLTY